MSRTYHHGDKAKERRWGNRFTNYRYLCGLDTGYEPTPPKKKRTHNHWRWLQNEPSWWVHEMMEKPYRRFCRDILAKVSTGAEDVVLRPYNKPHLYYW